MADYTGDDDNNSFTGTSDPETIRGLGGNDRLVGWDASNIGAISGDWGVGDTIEGGDGNDTLYAGRSSVSTGGPSGLWRGVFLDTETDTVDGGAGDDIIYSSGGNDTLIGGDGTDKLFWDYVLPNDVVLTTAGGMGATFMTIENFEIDIRSRGERTHTITLGDGNDVVEISEVTGTNINTQSTIVLGAGNDRGDIEVGNGSIDGGDGNDILTAGGEASNVVVLLGGAGDDRLSVETSGTFDGGDGYDLLTVGGFDSGGAGITLLRGSEDGSFTMSGFLTGTITGIEQLEFFGTIGTDIVDGTDNDDEFNLGEGGNDIVNGFGGNDYIYGSVGTGDMTLFGGDGDDDVFSGTGADQLYGGNGDDILDADEGDDFLDGGAGDDSLYGAEGDDFIRGGLGRFDYLEGDAGTDILVGDVEIALSGLEGQLYRAFRAVFDRAPDKDGFTAFLTEMRLGNLDQVDVIGQFVASQEFDIRYGSLSNTDFVSQIFANVLPNNTDASGQAAYVAALDAGSLTRADVVVELANSNEFVTDTTLASAGFATNMWIDADDFAVYRLYQATLGREPDVDGFLANVTDLQQGVQTLEQLVVGFTDSAEFQATYGQLTNAQFVELLYTNVLPGNNDAVGRANYVAALDNGTILRAEIVAQFVNSFEFLQSTQQAAEDFMRDAFSGRGDELDDSGGDTEMLGGYYADLFNYTEGALLIHDFVVGQDQIDTGSDAGFFDNFADFMATGSQVGQDTVFDFGNGNSITLSNVNMDDLTADDFTRFDAPSSQKPVDTHPSMEAPAPILASGFDLPDGDFLGDVWL